MEKAVAAQKECSQRLRLPVEITNSIGMKLKLIPAGEFLMGSAKSPQELVRLFDLDEERAKWFTHEQPQHRVRITKPFYTWRVRGNAGRIRESDGGRLQVTSRREGRGADHVSGKDTSRHPVENVSWDDAMEFCEKTIGQGREDVSPADRGRVGIRLPCGNDDAVQFWRRPDKPWRVRVVCT